MRLNNNVVALQTLTNMYGVNKKIEKAMQRISSGLKINSVKDDAAGLAIGNKMDNQLRGIEMGNKNALDGISMVQTAGGALTEMQGMVQRMRELAVQAANDTNTTDDRIKMQEEVNQLLQEIDGIVDRTEFNNIKLLDGSLTTAVSTVANGVKTNNLIDVVFVTDKLYEGDFTYQIDKVGTPAKVVGTIDSAILFSESNFSINGVVVNIEQGDSGDIVMNKIKDAANAANIEVFTPNYPNTGDLIFVSNLVGKENGITLEPPGSVALSTLGLASGVVKGTEPVLSNLTFTDKAGNSNNNYTAINTGNRIEVKGQSGQKIDFDIIVQTNANGQFQLADGTLVNDDGTFTSSGPLSVASTVEDFGSLILQIGPNKNMELELSIPKVSTESLGLSNIVLTTLDEASLSIAKLDKALSSISVINSRIGSYENRLQYASESLMQASASTSNAISRIMDADMAQEMMILSQNNVISQAGIAMMAQANQRPQQILQLLG